MMRPGDDVDVYLCREVVDMRKSINGLSIRVEQALGLRVPEGCRASTDPLSVVREFPEHRLTRDGPCDSTRGMMGTEVPVEAHRLRLLDRLTTRAAGNKLSVIVPCAVRSHEHLLGL
jgi:hypothetical protein